MVGARYSGLLLQNIAEEQILGVQARLDQPLARRVRVGRTECINVGHFRATGRPYVLVL